MLRGFPEEHQTNKLFGQLTKLEYPGGMQRVNSLQRFMLGTRDRRQNLGNTWARGPEVESLPGHISH